MGLAKVGVKVKKSRDARRSRQIDFRVDSCALHSIVADTVLRALRCRPYRKRDFFSADGTNVTRSIGDAYFEYRDVGAPAPVGFGEEDDRSLLGVTALEALELVFDPFGRELRPLTVPLMGAVPEDRERSR